MENQHIAAVLHKMGNGILDIFRQDHTAVRYRSRLWYMLPVLFNLAGGIVSFLAIRYDDPDKAKNCLLLGIILFMPFFLIAFAAVYEISTSDINMDSLCTDIDLDAAGPVLGNDGFATILCD